MWLYTLGAISNIWTYFYPLGLFLLSALLGFLGCVYFNMLLINPTVEASFCNTNPDFYFCDAQEKIIEYIKQKYPAVISLSLDCLDFFFKIYVGITEHASRPHFIVRLMK